MCVRVCVKGMHIPCARNTKNVLVFYLSALRMIRFNLIQLFQIEGINVISLKRYTHPNLSTAFPELK